jgi:hypothetical protein
MSPLNPYFLQGSPSEQRLVQDLINEHLSIYGQDVLYIPRKIINEERIIKEVIFSKFDDSFRLEAYISTFNGFGGGGDILSKFGVRSTDEITFVISKERYEDFITPKLGLFRDPNVKLKTRPQEGDLIYLPLNDSLFEIKYVEAATPFFQLNNLYVYEIRCELFEYEDEIIDTGIDEVDRTVKDYGYMATIQMVGSGASTASLSVGLATSLMPVPFGRSVSKVTIINGGYGYKLAPKIVFSSPVGGGVTATGFAILDRNSISKILITNPGIGYTEPPSIIIRPVGSYGSDAFATASISNGVLGPIRINSGGVGYTTAPTINITGTIFPFPSGSENNAVVESFITSVGTISTVGYLNAGVNYQSNPQPEITASSAIVGISTGDYEFNEVITGSTTGTTAYVKDWNATTRTLKVSIVDGNFAIGESLVGAAATYRISSIKIDDVYDPYAENEEIQEYSDQILDFSERNPFGEF